MGMLSFTSAQSPERFYYAFKERIPLAVVNNKTIIRYARPMNRAQAASSLRTNAAATQLQWQDDRTVVVTTNQSAATQWVLQQAAIDEDILTSNPVYALGTGLEMGVTDELLVQFLPFVTKSQQTALLNEYGVLHIKTTSIYQLLRVPKGKDALAIANRLQESGLVEFSYPNFISEIERHQAPNDEFFNQQFNLLNTGQLLPDGHAGTSGADINVLGAWTKTLGSSAIVIAVLDEGVTSDHPDLPNSRQIRINGSNFADGNPDDPSPTGDFDHGNSCAGLIAATQGNGQGISGVAPNCRIMPIRIFGSSGTGIAANRLADAILFAANNGADVISNSWGYNNPNPNLEPVIVNAIQFATTQGRNGRGCVVAFSAGNTARRSRADNGFVSFPASVTIPGVLTVGASDRNDQQSDYSPSGNPSDANNQLIDITAPSHRAYAPTHYPGGDGGIMGETFEVWTIDTPGSVGYNPWPVGNVQPPFAGEQLPSSGVNFLSYTGRFGGTSAACPQVAGVAALLLSVNPTLTQQQIFSLLTSTASKVGGYTYSGGQSNELGYGRVNANDAVQQALTDLCSIRGTYYYLSDPYSTQGYVTLQDFNYLPKAGRYLISVSTGLNGAAMNPWMWYGSQSSAPYYTQGSDNQELIVDIAAGRSAEFTVTNTTSACGALSRTFRIYVSSGGYYITYAPNPATSELVVSTADANSSGQRTPINQSAQLTPVFEARLYDSFGNQVKFKASRFGKAALDVRDLPNGLYTLRAGAGETAITKRIQIAH